MLGTQWYGAVVVVVVVVLVVVVPHIQRIGRQPPKTTLHGGESRSWSTKKRKKIKKKSGSDKSREVWVRQRFIPETF